MEMIERLARAMSEVDRAEAGEAADFADWHWEEHREHAIAVLDALREPTEAMILAGVHHENTGDMVGRWRAMIDAANPMIARPKTAAER
jgi:hypothetical protein